ncbi:hypothetical protein C8R43DRAFT_1131647 [Mycena crocata]|nr:hypothetical protein C8R43DRAFT_1131647 [Mycena crocata]
MPQLDLNEEELKQLLATLPQIIHGNSGMPGLNPQHLSSLYDRLLHAQDVPLVAAGSTSEMHAHAHVQDMPQPSPRTSSDSGSQNGKENDRPDKQPLIISVFEAHPAIPNLPSASSLPPTAYSAPPFSPPGSYSPPTIHIPNGASLLPGFLLRPPSPLQLEPSAASPSPPAPPGPQISAEYNDLDCGGGAPMWLSPLLLGGTPLSPSSPFSPTSTLVSFSGAPDKLADETAASFNMGTETPFPFRAQTRSMTGKRTASQAGLEDPPVIISGRARGRGRGRGGMGTRTRTRDGGRGDGYHPGRTSHCDKRGGDAPRITRPARGHRIASTIAGMQAQLQEPSPPPNKRGCKRTGGKKAEVTKKDIWIIDGDPPKAEREPVLHMVQLGLMAISHDHQHKLANFLLDLQPDSNSPSNPCDTIPAALLPVALERSRATVDTPFVAAMKRCAALENSAVMNDFHLMMSYVQAALYIQSRLKAPVPPDQRKATQWSLAQEVDSTSITSDTIGNWLKRGSRLLYLAASSSMYIIPMIAVCGLRNVLCKTEQLDVIQRLSYLLCAPHASDHPHTLSRDCGNLLRKLVVPQMVFIHQVSSHLTETFCVDFPDDHGNSIAERIPFKDFRRMRERLLRFDFNYYKLPNLDECWNAMEDPMLAPALPLTLEQFNITEDCVAPEVTIKTPLKLGQTVCPVTAENSFEWTAAERAKVTKAEVATSLEDLQNKLNKLHLGGTCSDDYVIFPTEICNENVVTLRDNDNTLIGMVVPNLTKTLPHLQTVGEALVSAVMEGEVYPVDSSDDPNYKFCATHKVIWNRYPEKGNTAPAGFHPNTIRKEGATHVNFTQRAPHPSDEIKDDPLEAAALAEFIKLVTFVIEFHLRKLLPDEYAAIKVYVERLPLNERSLAHPFGGFVINVRVSTRGHRDTGDKLLCVVIPFGCWTGGELGMYEPGVAFRLRSWDALIFPSCKITHFNLDFKGSRLSLVLHSDKYGDHWIQDQNGWAARQIAENLASSGSL